MSDKFDFDQYDDAPMDFDQFEDVATEEPKAPEGQQVTQGEAALAGAQQGLTMGFSDEIGAGMQKGMEATHRGARNLQDLYNEYIAAKTPLPEVDAIPKSATQQAEELAAQGFTGDIGPTSTDEVYDEALQDERARLKAAEEQHGKTYMAGDIAGSLLIPVPGAGAAKAGGKILSKAGKLGKAAEKGAKAAKGMSKAKKMAAAGAATGAVEAAGRTEEDLGTAEGLIDVGQGALAGGAFGGLLGKGAKALDDRQGKKLAKAAQLEEEANEAALKSIGAKSTDFMDEFGLKTSSRATADKAKGTGKALLDEDLIKMRQNPKEVKKALVEKLDEVGSQRIAPSAQKLDELAADMPLENFSDDLNAFAQKSDETLEQIAGGADYARGADKAMYGEMANVRQKVFEDIESVLESPNKIEELVNIKRKLQKQVNWNNPEATPYNEFLVNMQGNISDLINNMGQKIDPKVATEMADANATYHKLLNANKIAGKEMARDAASEVGLGFRDYLASGVISQATKIPGAGPAVIGAKKLIEKGTGKDTSKLINTMEAFQKSKKAQKLKGEFDYGDSPMGKLAEAYDTAKDKAGQAISEGAQKIDAAKATAVASGRVDEQKSKEPYKMQREAARYAERATPEELQSKANEIRDEYGQAGDKLAQTLDKISERDKQGRRALIFSLMQDPMNRKMLGMGKDAEPKN